MDDRPAIALRTARRDERGADPPTMIESVPSMAPRSPPETGASRNSQRLFANTSPCGG